MLASSQSSFHFVLQEFHQLCCDILWEIWGFYFCSMRQLIRKLQRVTDPAVYRSGCLQLQSPLLMGNRVEDKYGRCGAHESKKNRGRRRSKDCCYTDVPEGYLPVYVGLKELRRFVINASFLNHPIFAELLQKSAQEYGYEQKGGLKIPCDVMLFEYIIFLLNNQESVAQTLRLSDMK